jgi:hypothetical protein
MMATQQLQAQLAALRPLHEARALLDQTQADLRQARTRIAAMESSRFWKLRRVWFRVKRSLGIPCNE